MTEVVDAFNAANTGQDQGHARDLTVGQDARQAGGEHGLRTRRRASSATRRAGSPSSPRSTSSRPSTSSSSATSRGRSSRSCSTPGSLAARRTGSLSPLRPGCCSTTWTLFAKAGLSAPKTWDDLKNAAVKTANPPAQLRARRPGQRHRGRHLLRLLPVEQRRRHPRRQRQVDAEQARSRSRRSSTSSTSSRRAAASPSPRASPASRSSRCSRAASCPCTRRARG